MNKSKSINYGVVGYGCYFIGLLLWFPSASILNIGGGSSVQTVVPVGVLVMALMIYAGVDKFSFRFLSWFGALIFLLLIQSFTLINKTGDLSLYFKGMTSFTLSLFMLPLGYLVARSIIFTRAFFNGYVTGGIISSIWAVTQYIFWSILKTDFPLLVGIQNSVGFAKYASDDSYIRLGRGFACTPEPSVLFVLLSSCLALLIYKRRSLLQIILIVAGILSTASIGIVLVLPMSLVYLLYVSGRIKLNTVLFIFISLATGISLFIVISLQNMSLANLTHDTNVISRINNISNNASFISRTNSIIVAFDMFQQRPLLGWGVQSEEIVSTLLANSTSVEENKGINSLLLSMIVWFGALFTITCMYPTARLVIINSKKLAETSLFVVITLIGAFTSIGYYNLYNVWFAFGMASFAMDVKYNFTQNRRNTINKHLKEIYTT